MHTNGVSRNIRAALIVLSLLLLGAVLAQAQTPLASVSGVITDPSGAVVPNVKVTVTDTERGEPFVTQTNQTGAYLVKDLIPSTYKITAEASGFRTYVLDTFPLTALQAAILNISLQLGTASQTVEVQAQAQMVEPSNATLGGLVNNATIEDLPLVNRNIVTLMTLLPGVTPSTPNSFSSTFFTSAVRYSMNGGMESTSEFELDGISFLNQSDIPGILGMSVLPSVESIQEFRVQTSDYSASYGRSGGGITTMVTKSGTNKFHGSGYEFLQNTAFESNSYPANAANSTIAPYHYDDYGFSVGGPVIKNKTFGFFSYERNLSHGGGFSQFSVPTAAERQGNFASDFNSKGQLITIYDPTTTAPDPANPGKYIRTAFPGNIIPTTEQDPVALKASTYWPAANLPGLAIPSLPGQYQPVNNFGASAVASSPVSIIGFKVDHNISGNKRLFARYDYYSSTYGDPNIFGNKADEGFGTLVAGGHNAVLGYTQTIGSGTVLDLRAGFNRFVAYRPSQGLDFDLTTLGLPASLVGYSALGNEPEFPYFGPQGYSGLGNDEGPYYTSHNQDWLFSGSLSKVVGRHTLTMGAQSTSFFLNFYQINPFVVSFSNAMTQGPDPTLATLADGDGYASMLTGLGASGSISDTPQPANANHYFAEFVQDDFKMTSKLTINLGFRIEQETATTERHNRMTAIDPTILNPVSQDVGFNVYGGYVFAGNGPDSLGRRAIRGLEWKPNPRIGIAYMFNSKTVIRAGYGIFYSVPDDGATDSFTGGTFSTGTNLLGTLDGIHPNPGVTLSNPFPQGYVYPAGTSQGLLSDFGQGLSSAWPQQLKDAYNQQWNLTVQRSIASDMMLQVAYVGSKATHIGMLSPSMDQLPPQYQSNAVALSTTLVTNPFAPYVSGGTLAQPTVSQGQLDLPYPGWTSVSPQWPPFGDAEYDALQVMMQKRYTSGSSFTAGYTWSKTMTDVFDGLWSNNGGPTQGSIRSFYCLHCEHGISSYDVPNRFVLSGLEVLPFGKGKRFGSGMPSYANAIVGGWQVNGILTLATGMPLEFHTAQNTSYSYGGNQHPDATGVPASLGGAQTIYEWFNPAAFAQPANGTFGNLARAFAGVRQDWTRNLDFSIFKNFRIKEWAQLQFRAEAFNLTNTPIFGAPNTTVGSPGFGDTGGGQQNSPRNFQLALKLTF